MKSHQSDNVASRRFMAPALLGVDLEIFGAMRHIESDM